MFELKPLHRDAIPAALDKAMRYRLLNEPGAAESICLDVLKVDPDHQQALVTLLLAMTDRLAKGYTVGDTQIQDHQPGCDEQQGAVNGLPDGLGEAIGNDAPEFVPHRLL